MWRWTPVVDVTYYVELIDRYSLDKGADDLDEIEGNIVFNNICNKGFVVGSLVVFRIVCV